MAENPTKNRKIAESPPETRGPRYLEVREQPTPVVSPAPSKVEYAHTPQSLEASIQMNSHYAEGISPELRAEMDSMGERMDNLSKSHRINTKLLKELTGGDAMHARQLNGAGPSWFG